jgi:hypothetical protein
MCRKQVSIIFLMMSALTVAAGSGPADQCRFIGIRKFTDFTSGSSSGADGSELLSPVIKAPPAAWHAPAPHGAMLLSRLQSVPMAWNELVVSWNADVPPEASLKIEAQAVYPDHTTKFYTMGLWSRDSTQHPRGSVRHQGDDDGTVNDDTLVLTRPGADVRLKLTLAGSNDARFHLKFLGLSFLDNRAQPAPLRPRRAAWGKIIPTPELSQHSYPEGEGWCSPTSLAMVLRRWGEVLHRPDLNLDVPEVAAGVYDGVLEGTGNWPFNTAYAGSFPGLRAYVARFSDLSEVEDWIAAGIPVILSARWDLLAPGRKPTGSGHLVVCIGFTDKGDVVVNDPATNLQKGQQVLHIYTRQNFTNAWRASHNTVYLVYPETARIPGDRFGHWEKHSSAIRQNP